jgi:hypothetical protein
MSDHTLNEIGLTSEIKFLMNCLQSRTSLQEEFNKAKTALDKNEESIKEIKVKLGNHTKQTGRSEVVLVDDYAAIIPVPPPGYNDYAVHIEFVKPKSNPYK